VEDRLRAGRVSATAIADTVGLMNRAANVLNGAMQATKSMANELAAVPGAMRQATTPQATNDDPRDGHDESFGTRHRRRTRPDTPVVARRSSDGQRSAHAKWSPAEKARAEPLVEGAPRTGAKRTVMYYIKQFPATCVCSADGDRPPRGGARQAARRRRDGVHHHAIDLIPDFIPFFGEIDDLYLLIFAVAAADFERRTHRAPVALERGGRRSGRSQSAERAISAAAFFLPRRDRRRLRVIGRE